MFFLSRVDLLAVITGLLLYCGLIWFLHFSLVRFMAIANPRARRALFWLLLVLGFSFVLEMLIPWGAGSLRDVVYGVFGVWICLFLQLLAAAVLLWPFAWVHRAAGLRVRFTRVAGVVLAVPFLVTAFGVWQGSDLVVREVSIPVKSLPPYWRDKTLVHISDLHLRRPEQVAFMKRVVAVIAEIGPEVVVITGDLFDVRSEDHAQQLLAPFGELSPPVLIVTGNHDRYFSRNRDPSELASGNLILLDGRLYEREGVQIIGLGYPGRGEAADPATVLRERIVYDRDKPTLLLYHLPTTIEADKQGDRYISPNTDFTVVKEMGIDAQLSGHTHGGQFFPLSVVTHFLYNGYAKGLHRDGDFSLHVSSGIGTWGPPLRIFVPPEIVVVRLTGRS